MTERSLSDADVLALVRAVLADRLPDSGDDREGDGGGPEPGCRYSGSVHHPANHVRGI
jgi:hypothetical protein